MSRKSLVLILCVTFFITIVFLVSPWSPFPSLSHLFSLHKNELHSTPDTSAAVATDTQKVSTDTFTSIATSTLSNVASARSYKKAKLLSEEDSYRLYATSTYDGLNDLSVWYVDDGVIEKGVHAGKHLIVAHRDTGDPSYPIDYFVTKDFKTFTVLYAESEKDLFSNAVQGLTGALPRDVKVLQDAFRFPASLGLKGSFALTRGTVVEPEALEGTIKYSALSYPGLTFFARPVMSSSTADGVGTTLYAVDAHGLVLFYSLSNKVDTLHNDFGTANERALLLAKEIQNKNSIPLYSSYTVYEKNGCSSQSRLVSKDAFTSQSLEEVGSYNSLTMYRLKDTGHVLIKKLYNDMYVAGADGKGGHTAYLSKEAKEVSLPSEKEYVSKNPVLLVDMGEYGYLLLAENDYAGSGGCGKPVVYLYPEKDEIVEVSFPSIPSFHKVIPSYTHGWRVLAKSSGELSLVNNQENCDSYRNASFGLEYAYDACLQNSYPYLYWSGSVLDKPYPHTEKGFSVAKSEFASSLYRNLTHSGLSEKEAGDMVSYWNAIIQKDTKPFVTYSLFDTSKMNSFIPMKVTPRPDTVIRVFLDWHGRDELDESIPPQTLTKVARKGFVLVEWGGLKE